ncbi:hypothetical protein GYMLUDRAFT_45497 [Collybiopsis luxurians FD-317 M1]|uniref:AB hydrolase-1 domain-containing protein n=1 Tax=Collybiopsis luxurians FD-317 M1 TaxID=944289 RepID=A0A0D0C703_9AGAR|nr:hypothetical protein GYMLUDRAFT_45497 [Collybiopsis luxurians FD-317 M1]
MEITSYKDHQVSRGFTYHYYFSPPKYTNQPKFLVFVHGFPSTSKDWRKQVPFFESRGFGLIIPDLLGYGGTSKPLDVTAYNHKLIAQDIIDILDFENVNRAFFIGHDWGTKIVSLITLQFPSRALGAAFLSVGPSAPPQDLKFEAVLALQKEKVGHELFGYWPFFSEPDGWKLCEEKIDTFFNIVYPEDPRTWITELAPIGALKNALLANKQFPPPSWMSPEERKDGITALLSGSLQAPTMWYKYATSGLATENELNSFPTESYKINMPVFFGGALDDFVCLAGPNKKRAEEYCTDATFREYKTSHWLMLQVPEQLNEDLLSWIESVVETAR